MGGFLESVKLVESAGVEAAEDLDNGGVLLGVEDADGAWLRNSCRSVLVYSIFVTQSFKAFTLTRGLCLSLIHI